MTHPKTLLEMAGAEPMLPPLATVAVVLIDIQRELSTPERKYISGRSKNASVGEQRKSWFGFWQGEREGDLPPRYCSEYLMWRSSDQSSLTRVLAAVDHH